MTTINFKAEQFKKMDDPVNAKSGRVRYVCYAKADTLPNDMENWMETNPREQKMTTNVARTIQESLRNNTDFHELNRGILLSAKNVTYDNKTNVVTVIMEDSSIHGNIDGGHTLRAILEAQKQGVVATNRFVFMEIFTGLDSAVELAAARNTSVPVDLKSIEELRESFFVIKDSLSSLSFADRVAYKMNEHYNDQSIQPIDVREIITIMNMFNQAIYPIRSNDGRLADLQPVQCYTGKEASLRRFLNLGQPGREEIIKNMKPIIQDIFTLWDAIECNLSVMAGRAGKRYGTRKYARHNDGQIVGRSAFNNIELLYIVPKGLMYPLVGAFRALVTIEDNVYGWCKPPLEVWNKIGPQLVSIILDERIDTPDGIAKNSNLWSNLFKEVFIYGRSM